MTHHCALIIEDDPKLASIFSTSLQAAGIDTVVDLEGNRYQSVLESGIVDIIFLDVHLPFASGIDIFKKIRSSEQWTNLPIVIMTADLNAAKTLENQADRILIKPVTVGRLQETALGLLTK
jgi:DNA-binding response OmpR family regulator